ncbi:MAG: hypothetical protein J0I07_08065 [Myxococcales bacterium]|nr:hypothetical protein [Myxococcales bacterium]
MNDQVAREEFGATDLGDVRCTRRPLTMAMGAAHRPSGKVAAVFDRPAEREGTYDLRAKAPKGCRARG